MTLIKVKGPHNEKGILIKLRVQKREAVLKKKPILGVQDLVKKRNTRRTRSNSHLAKGSKPKIQALDAKSYGRRSAITYKKGAGVYVSTSELSQALKALTSLEENVTSPGHCLTP